MRKLYSIVALIVALMVPVSCTTPVQTIVSHPWRYDGKKVKVRGKVVNTLHLDDLSFFTVRGGRSKVNVITNDFLPVVGDNVKVKGRVISKFYYQRDTILVIRELVKPREGRGVSPFNKSVK